MLIATFRNQVTPYVKSRAKRYDVLITSDFWYQLANTTHEYWLLETHANLGTTLIYHQDKRFEYSQHYYNHLVLRSTSCLHSCMYIVAGTWLACYRPEPTDGQEWGATTEKSWHMHIDKIFVWLFTSSMIFGAFWQPYKRTHSNS